MDLQTVAREFVRVSRANAKSSEEAGHYRVRRLDLILFAPRCGSLNGKLTIQEIYAKGATLVVLLRMSNITRGSSGTMGQSPADVLAVLSVESPASGSATASCCTIVDQNGNELCRCNSRVWGGEVSP
jgi:hypothetical protein